MAMTEKKIKKKRNCLFAVSSAQLGKYQGSRRKGRPDDARQLIRRGAESGAVSLSETCETSDGAQSESSRIQNPRYLKKKKKKK